MKGIKFCVISFFLMHISLHGCYGLTCKTPDGPCKCATDEGDIDISSLDGSGTAAYVTKLTQIFENLLIIVYNFKIIPYPRFIFFYETGF